MTHLTNQQIDAYWGSRLAPADLLLLDRHASDCPACREALWAAAPDAGAFARLDLGEAEPAGGHLDYGEMERYVDGDPAAGLRAAVEGHVETCTTCRAELQDLRRFRDEYRAGLRPSSPARKPPASAIPPRARLAVAALALAATVCVAVLSLDHRGGFPARVAPQPVEVATALLRDAGQPLRLDSQGGLRGLAGLSDAEHAELAAILRGGDLPLAKARPDLQANGSLLRSAPAQTPEFALTDPLGRVVLEDRPVLQWSALPRASSYRVAILDQDFHLVAESPVLVRNQWRPDKPLPRGRALSWQVTAVRGGVEVHAPQPPVSEARFAVLDQSLADRLAATLARRPVSHLALSALYARAGMPRECLQELQFLETENPRSPLVARLRSQIAGSIPSR